MKQIECALAFMSGEISYVAYGTIAWLKTTDNMVRQAKCIGAYTKPHADNPSRGLLVHVWKVAGIKETFETYNASRIKLGILYAYKDCAQNGSAKWDCPTQMGELKYNKVVSVHKFLIEKYNLAIDNFEFRGTWNNFLSVLCYEPVEKDHTAKQVCADFDICVNENGVDIIVPRLDNHTIFPTKYEACASMAQLTTITFDDEVAEQEEDENEQKVRITIEVTTKDLSKIKAFAEVVNE